MPPVIHLDALSVTYGRTRAVDEFSFEVEDGEIVGLLGPNGAGKTSTIKVLVGLLKPAAGAVRIAGHDLQGGADLAKARTAYVPDKPHLYELLSAWEYLEFVAGLWGRDGDDAWKARAEKELVRFGIWENRDQLLESFSQGMRQKTLLIAGLIHEPDAWVLDEPMSGLDPRAARQMRDVFREEADRGAAILFSTHTLDIAERMCDRIVIIDRGRKVAEGTMAELRATRVADAGGVADGAGDHPHERLEDLFFRLTETDDEIAAARGLEKR
jgi:ABC-2 type transport system ATP-binding protein